MNPSKAAFDLVSERECEERQAGVDLARAALSIDGSGTCSDCGVIIPNARRRAAPFARRCLECQTLVEQEKYHR